MRISKLTIAFATVAILASQFAARAGTPIVIFFPAESHPWSVAKKDPYAVWDAESKNAPSTEVDVDGKSAVVDFAPIKPQSLYASDGNLMEGSRVWLPKDGLLVKMSGGTKNWFCTWRFDEKSGVTQAEADNDNLSGFGEYNLCLRSESSGMLSDPRVMIADFKGLMTITDQESGMGRYRNGVGYTNPISIRPVDSDLLPVRAQLQVRAKWKSAHGGAVCLHVAIASMKSVELLGGEEQCFSNAGANFHVAGGAYELISINDHTAFRFRIQSPINVHGLSPRLLD